MEVKHINLGTTNQNKVVIRKDDESELSLYFSYETIVGFEYTSKDRHIKRCMINYWKQTTGKLLNKIEANKEFRLNEQDFRAELNKIFCEKGFEKGLKF